MTVTVPVGSEAGSEVGTEPGPEAGPHADGRHDRPAGRDRLDRALAALRAAEQRTGVASTAGGAVGLGGPGTGLREPRRLPQPDLPEPQRPRSEPLGPRPERRELQPPVLRRASGAAETRAADGGPWPVHPDLAQLLPGGVLPAGGTVAVLGSTALLLALLAAASRAGAWVAFVGAPAVGMLAAADAGIELERVALVPAPGPDAPAAVAALLDGMDLVVVGPQAPLLDGDRRRLAARARERGAVLVATGAWPGAHVRLDARGGAWSGADRGSGWLRRRTLRVLRTGRGAAARPVEIDVEVPLRATVVVPGLPAGMPASPARPPAQAPLPAAAGAPGPSVPAVPTPPAAPTPLRVVA
ncbi:hypothetical protein [Puerhibacterium puerhi]|uniref:hypothetical protein n=1 Tax=Puerhibacterium puerhi TaxID=2692623 RepID=UPI0019161DE0|nr:hypothetical protein [Puerhibacterium puerhi]